MGQGEEASLDAAGDRGLPDVVRVEPEGAAGGEGGGVTAPVAPGLLDDWLTVLQVRNITGKLLAAGKQLQQVKGLGVPSDL